MAEPVYAHASGACPELIGIEVQILSAAQIKLKIKSEKLKMFKPGKIVRTFVSEKEKEIVISYPRWEDLYDLTRYINKLSREDTFINKKAQNLYKN